MPPPPPPPPPPSAARAPSDDTAFASAPDTTDGHPPNWQLLNVCAVSIGPITAFAAAGPVKPPTVPANVADGPEIVRLPTCRPVAVIAPFKVVSPAVSPLIVIDAAVTVAVPKSRCARGGRTPAWPR